MPGRAGGERAPEPLDVAVGPCPGVPDPPDGHGLLAEDALEEPRGDAEFAADGGGAADANERGRAVAHLEEHQAVAGSFKSGGHRYPADVTSHHVRPHRRRYDQRLHEEGAEWRS